MRSIAVSIGLAVASLIVAATWMAWVVSQGTNQVIQPGWPAFKYAAFLLVALLLSLSALLGIKIRPPTNHSAALAIGIAAGLESLLFGFVWMALVFQLFLSP